MQGLFEPSKEQVEAVLDTRVHHSVLEKNDPEGFLGRLSLHSPARAREYADFLRETEHPSHRFLFRSVSSEMLEGKEPAAGAVPFSRLLTALPSA